MSATDKRILVVGGQKPDQFSGTFDDDHIRLPLSGDHNVVCGGIVAVYIPVGTVVAADRKSVV